MVKNIYSQNRTRYSRVRFALKEYNRLILQQYTHRVDNNKYLLLPMK